MTLRKTALLALCLLPLAAPAAFAQANDYGKNVDLKPLLPPVIPPPLLPPPNSLLTPGSAYGDSVSPYSRGPLNDPTRDQATPGLRLTIPR